MGNVDDKCKECRVNDIVVRQLCRPCYKKFVRKGKISVNKQMTSPDILTSFQKEVLIGTLLGDAWISNRNKKPHIQINRSIKDKGYLVWQYEVFKDFCNHGIKDTVKYDKKRQVSYKGVSLLTRGAPIFKSYREEWYKDGKKVIPKDLILTPLSIAIWLCDDGCITYGRYKRSLGVKFATNGFDLNDVKFICNLLNDRYKHLFSISKNGNGYVIRGGHDVTLELINEIKSFIPPSMQRKLKRYYESIEK